MKKLLPILAVAAIATAASAQLTGFRAYLGYGWGGGIKDVNNNTRHLMGPDLGVEMPFSHLPVVDIYGTAEVLLGGQLARGGDLDGNVYRFMAGVRAHVPGSGLEAFYATGWATAQARAGEFGAFNAWVHQLGIAYPLAGGKVPLVGPELRLMGNFSAKSGLSSWVVAVGIRF